jgi:hypothetical protein
VDGTCRSAAAADRANADAYIGRSQHADMRSFRDRDGRVSLGATSVLHVPFSVLLGNCTMLILRALEE